MREHGLFIGGRWMESATGDLFETRSPSTGELLAVHAKGSEIDVERAVEAAEKAFPAWKALPAPKRGEILLKAASLLRGRKEEMGALITKEMGKVIAEGKGEVQEAIDFLEYISGEGRRLLGETTTSELPRKFCMTVRRPIGIVGCITPWNFPVAVPCWKLGAALISGNTVVFKPSTLTPLCAAVLVEVLQEAGLPHGVLNLVTGPAGDVGEAMVRHPKIKAISFTGGVETGREIYSKASALMKRVGLELGGKNPQIVLQDADLDLAVEGALFGAFGTAGQRCTATSRLIVHRGVYQEVADRLLARTAALKIGDPLDPSVDMGPVVSEEQREKVLTYMGIGSSEGAKLLIGGKKMEGGPYDKGFFVQPTLFEAVQGMRITREEIFGPVLCLIRAEDYEEAVQLANDVGYGLSSSIYTRDVTLAFRAMEELEAGITYVNAPTIGAEVHLPFGGVKDTGNGTREAGTAAIEEFTELKSIFVDYSGRLQKAQIEG